MTRRTARRPCVRSRHTQRRNGPHRITRTADHCTLRRDRSAEVRDSPVVAVHRARSTDDAMPARHSSSSPERRHDESGTRPRGRPRVAATSLGGARRANGFDRHSSCATAPGDEPIRHRPSLHRHRQRRHVHDVRSSSPWTRVSPPPTRVSPPTSPSVSRHPSKPQCHRPGCRRHPPASRRTCAGRHRHPGWNGSSVTSVLTSPGRGSSAPSVAPLAPSIAPLPHRRPRGDRPSGRPATLVPRPAELSLLPAAATADPMAPRPTPPRCECRIPRRDLRSRPLRCSRAASTAGSRPPRSTRP